MPGIFESGIVQVSSSVGTIASLVWDPNNTSTTTFGALGAVGTTSSLRDVMVSNTGTANCYLNWSSQAAAAANGVLCPAGGGVAIFGYTGTGGSTTNRIWAQTGTVGLTTQVQAGLLTIGAGGVI